MLSSNYLMALSHPGFVRGQLRTVLNDPDGGKPTLLRRLWSRSTR